MSGGVDSSVAAYLMLQQGYECRGTTMRLYRNADIGLNPFHTCCSQRDIDDAAEAERTVSELMGDQVEPRKEFIQKHARDVRFLDI